jgi:hypothetical protein
MPESPRLADVAATLVAYANGTEAISVSVVIPQGEDVSSAIVRYDRLESVLTVAEGDEVRSLQDVEVLGGNRIGTLHVHRFPDFEVDLDEGKIVGAVGAMEDLARSLEALAHLFGEGALTSGEFRTKAPAEPLELGTNGLGEFVVTCGEVAFEVPENWPTR